MAVSRGEAAVEQVERDLGERVRSLRKSQGLTQQQLADRANTSVGAIKHLETGQGATTRTLARALRALGAQDWVRTLHEPASTFNPMHLLDGEAAAKRGGKGAA